MKPSCEFDVDHDTGRATVRDRLDVAPKGSFPVRGDAGDGGDLRVRARGLLVDGAAVPVAEIGDVTREAASLAGWLHEHTKCRWCAGTGPPHTPTGSR